MLKKIRCENNFVGESGYEKFLTQKFSYTKISGFTVYDKFSFQHIFIVGCSFNFVHVIPATTSSASVPAVPVLPSDNAPDSVLGEGMHVCTCAIVVSLKIWQSRFSVLNFHNKIFRHK